MTDAKTTVETTETETAVDAAQPKKKPAAKKVPAKKKPAAKKTPAKKKPAAKKVPAEEPKAQPEAPAQPKVDRGAEIRAKLEADLAAPCTCYTMNAAGDVVPGIIVRDGKQLNLAVGDGEVMVAKFGNQAPLHHRAGKVGGITWLGLRRARFDRFQFPLREGQEKAGSKPAIVALNTELADDQQPLMLLVDSHLDFQMEPYAGTEFRSGCMTSFGGTAVRHGIKWLTGKAQGLFSFAVENDHLDILYKDGGMRRVTRKGNELVVEDCTLVEATQARIDWIQRALKGKEPNFGFLHFGLLAQLVMMRHDADAVQLIVDFINDEDNGARMSGQFREQRLVPILDAMRKENPDMVPREIVQHFQGPSAFDALGQLGFMQTGEK